MAAHFEKEILLRFREADPAGILFFGNIFGLAHDCFEDFIQATGMTWDEWFRTKDYMVPIRHSECNFLKPFFPGQKYTARVSVANIGDSSFQMKYVFSSKSPEGPKIHAEVLMVHTFLDAKSKQKISVPQPIRSHFLPYLESSSEKK